MTLQDRPVAKDELVRRGVIAGDPAFTGPYGIQLGIEGSCNYSCVFCGGFSEQGSSTEGDSARRRIRMPDDVVLRLVESAAKLAVEQLSLVGVGEPLLHPITPKLLDYVKAAGIRVMVTTNGSTLTRELGDRFLESGLDILNLSFSAATPDTYGLVHGARHRHRFETILATLCWLSSERRARSLGKPRIYRTYPCLVGWTYLLIREDGTVLPCCYCNEPLGNIYEQPLHEIWHSTRYDAFRQRVSTLPLQGQSQPGCHCFAGCGSVRDNIRTIERLGLREQLRRAPTTPWD